MVCRQRQSDHHDTDQRLYSDHVQILAENNSHYEELPLAVYVGINTGKV